jgi:thioesterase domain-containing protein
VKLGKNASDACVLLSEAYVGEVMKGSSDFEWHKWFEESLHVKINAHHFSQYQGYCSF